jgi:hypothetical protein
MWTQQSCLHPLSLTHNTRYTLAPLIPLVTSRKINALVAFTPIHMQCLTLNCNAQVQFLCSEEGDCQMHSREFLTFNLLLHLPALKPSTNQRHAGSCSSKDTYSFNTCITALAHCGNGPRSSNNHYNTSGLNLHHSHSSAVILKAHAHTRRIPLAVINQRPPFHSSTNPKMVISVLVL